MPEHVQDCGAPISAIIASERLATGDSQANLAIPLNGLAGCTSAHLIDTGCHWTALCVSVRLCIGVGVSFPC